MNKKFFTLVALLGLFVSFGANAADVVKGNYYYLKVTGAASAERYLSIYHTKADSLVGIPASTPQGVYAEKELALWKVDYTLDNVTGKYVYTIVNKGNGKQLSFSGNSNNGGVSNKATLGGSLKFASSTKEENDQSDFYSYISAQDSTLQLRFTAATFTATDTLAVSFAKVEKSNPVTPVNNNALEMTFTTPDWVYLTAGQLNAQLKGKGFRLFANYADKAVDTPFAGVTFEAVPNKFGTAAQNDTIVTLKAVSLSKKKGKDSYAYVDTMSYTTIGNLPTDGNRMMFKVDTIPTTDGTTPVIAGDTARFLIAYNPGLAKDSILVFVNSNIDPTGANNLVSGHTFGADYGTYTGTPSAIGAVAPDCPATWFPVQVDEVTTGASTKSYILTTGIVGTKLDPTKTRLAFTGDAIPNLLDVAKIYSVKNVNAKGFTSDVSTGGVKPGEYYGVGLNNNPVGLSAAYDQVPATQFVYDGYSLINRENANVALDRIAKVKDGVYTNVTDTFEVVALGTDAKDPFVGYKNINTIDRANKGYTFDYISGVVSGRSLNAILKDSTVIADDVNKMVFKLDTVANLKPAAFGPETIEKGAVQLTRQQYRFITKDAKYTIVEGDNGKLFITSTKSGKAPKYFYFREVETAKQYIMVDASNVAIGSNYASKYNVNSSSAQLEAVAISHANNAFAINDEFAAGYVLDAKGHYTLKTVREEGLAANANMFAAFRKLGELKAEYTEDDFKLYIDTAKVKGAETQPLYYILKGAEAGENGALQGNFLRVMQDSIDVEGYSIYVENANLPRLQFVSAKREVPGDSLLLNYAAETHVKGDSIGFKDKTDAIKQFRFSFKYANDGSDMVKIESAMGNNRFVAVQNNVAYLSTIEASALVLNMKGSDAPTGNDGDNAEADFQVYGVQGAVIVQGAADKAVTITNVLGQTITKKTIGSSYETISAPAGVVFVTVNGETVKALVK